MNKRTFYIPPVRLWMMISPVAAGAFSLLLALAPVDLEAPPEAIGQAVESLPSARPTASIWQPEERIPAASGEAAARDTDEDDQLLWDTSARPSPQQRRRAQPPERGVYKGRIAPHWLTDNARFWYRNDLAGGTKEFILVDALKATRNHAFDHARLAAALTKASSVGYTATRLPFADIAFVDDGGVIQFDAAGKTWRCELRTYACTSQSPEKPPGSAPSEPDSGTAATRPGRADGPGQDRGRRGDERNGSTPSPDGQWIAFTRDYNVFLRVAPDGQEWQLSQDGVETNSYGRLEWAPDSQSLVAWRIEPGDRKEVYLVQSSPPGGGRAKFRARPYALPGDRFTFYEPNVFEVTSRHQFKPEVDRFEHEYERPQLHWMRDRRHFAYEQVDRTHQRLRIVEVDSRTGAVRNLIDERAPTFIWTAHTENLGLTLVNWLDQTDEIIYVSERDGWRHLYLEVGGQLRPITQGPWVVRAIDRIDEEHRQIWFRACGRNQDQDPYLVHYYRINFDGTGLVALTKGNGNHTVQYSPDRNYLIDTYSRVDRPPIHELRRTADGSLVLTLETADCSELKADGWMPPEVFVAKGRDGRTDIWGIICRPPKLDPRKKYPVIESIYAGPQGAYVPKSFSGARRFEALTRLGFIVVQMDAMGTAFRSKAFHDVCWQNLKDAGFEDRILWHRAAARKYAYYDLRRVGIFGTSAGGQNAAAALLFHPDFYQVAVSNSGCHDNRMDKASWNEQWMGYPVGPQYAASSNIENAPRLRGKLLLIVGEMDTNVPPESTLRFVDALIEAGKDFDLLVVPNADHGISGPHNAYAQRRLQDFFVRHLLGDQARDGKVAGPGLK